MLRASQVFFIVLCRPHRKFFSVWPAFFFLFVVSLYFVFFFFFFLGMWYVSAICGFQKLCVFHFSKFFFGFSLAISDKGLTFALAFRDEHLL